jgi:hypothetical protein
VCRFVNFCRCSNFSGHEYTISDHDISYSALDKVGDMILTYGCLFFIIYINNYYKPESCYFNMNLTFFIYCYCFHNCILYMTPVGYLYDNIK